MNLTLQMVEPKIQERQGPHGSVEPVPNRSGVTSNQPVKVLSRANQDDFTDLRRAHYGDTNRYSIVPTGELPTLQAGDTRTIRNVTRTMEINGTFQRSSTQ